MGFIWEYLKGKSCEVFAAPFDVRLFPEEDSSDTTVVQPDILVVCDSKKLSDGKACKGAPDLVVEIMSGSSAIIDRNVKAEKYRQAGVKEYWIVNANTADPEYPIEIMVNVLSNGQYISSVYKNKVSSSVLPGLVIDLSIIAASVRNSLSLA
jgi:Uma2 family endonuclease